MTGDMGVVYAEPKMELTKKQRESKLRELAVLQDYWLTQARKCEAEGRPTETEQAREKLRQCAKEIAELQ